MNTSHRFISPSLLAAAVAAAIALLSACGGNDDAPPAATPEDQPDAATLAALSTHTSAVDTELRARGVATPDSPGIPQGEVPGQEPAHGWFPGVAQTNLVANRDGLGAQIIDPDLRNPWGIAIRPAGFGGHFWFASAGSGKSIQYVGDVGDVPLFQDELKVVDTLGPSSGTAFNHGSNFVITQQHPNGAITAPTKFFFANLSGTVTAWTERGRPGGGFDHPADSVPVIDGSSRNSSFIGVAVMPGADRLLVADFGAQAELRVYDGSFGEQTPLVNPYRQDTAKPGDFEAFNVQTLGQSVFAMYGRHVAPGTSPLPKEGRLAEFDAQGRLVAKWAGRGLLNYPWGVALAPQNFGLYSGCLLVGNFGDGRVVAFHPGYKTAIDYVRDDHGQPVVLDGLWGLQFGNGASLGEANHMYFASGPNKEIDGLVGKLEANPRTLPYISGISLCS